MRVFSRLLLLVIACALPSAARANAVEDLSVSTDEQDVIIVLRTKTEASEPLIRTERGSIRLWLEHAPQQTSIRHRVDSAEVSYVEVRSGSNDTAAIRIRLASRKQLPASAIRIVPDGKKLILRVARALLSSTAAAASTLPASHATKAASTAEPPPVEPVKTTSAAEAVALPASAFLATPKPLSQATLAPESSSSTFTLLGISLLLGVVYLGVHVLQKKRPKLAASPIEIIASKRLGPRHQLLIVRAFGRDHLLSVQGGTTTRIAGAKAGQMLGADDLGATGSFEFESDAKTERDQPAFGADFLRLAIGQRLNEEMKTEQARANANASASETASATRQNTSSNAVSGLMRLRREAGL